MKTIIKSEKSPIRLVVDGSNVILHGHFGARFLNHMELTEWLYANDRDLYNRYLDYTIKSSRLYDQNNYKPKKCNW